MPVTTNDEGVPLDEALRLARDILAYHRRLAQHHEYMAKQALTTINRIKRLAYQDKVEIR